MIKGIGIDIVEIGRIEECIKKYGKIFLLKVFTSREIEQCGRGKNSTARYAGRWAAKEAFFKAIPEGCQRTSSWKSIQILNGRNGRPFIDICCQELMKSVRKSAICRFHLSISHERTFCTAVVVAE